MPKQLIELKGDFEDAQKRVGPFLETLDRCLNNFFGDSGSWGRLMEGQQVLAARLGALHAATAAAPVAAADPEVQQLLAGIQAAKADCKSHSAEYYTTIERVKGVVRELATLKAKVDKVAADKAASLKKTNSVQALHDLSASVDRFKNNIAGVTAVGGPHLASHPALQ